jgi:hypothetical protein
MRSSWSVLILVAQPANQVRDVLRHPLIDDIVVQGAQLLPNARLNLSA